MQCNATMDAIYITRPPRYSEKIIQEYETDLQYKFLWRYEGFYRRFLGYFINKNIRYLLVPQGEALILEPWF